MRINHFLFLGLTLSKESDCFAGDRSMAPKSSHVSNVRDFFSFSPPTHKRTSAIVRKAKNK